jgi:tetratricopeptide (TPR) repeat protein
MSAPSAPPPEEKTAQPTITIKPVKKDNEYLKKLTGKLVDDYQTYLKLREDYANSPTFYFDMADWFYGHNDKETALRILTSIADLELENALLYRLLGYRFKEYGEYALQKFVTKKVIQWRPMEPQSYRDYALALADNGEAQAALDSLYSMLTRPYSANIGRRSRGMEEVVITEMNHLITKNANLNTSNMDKRLITDIPVDVRVVINWNMNNTDIDLHVIDPSGEECYYNRKRTSAGGTISADNTSGYGPEQFILKKAIKGKYQVYVNRYSSREFTVAGPATVMAEIYTKYADESEQRRVVSVQLSNIRGAKGSKVEIAEFEF